MWLKMVKNDAKDQQMAKTSLRGSNMPQKAKMAPKAKNGSMS